MGQAGKYYVNPKKVNIKSIGSNLTLADYLVALGEYSSKDAVPTSIDINTYKTLANVTASYTTTLQNRYSQFKSETTNNFFCSIMGYDYPESARAWDAELPYKIGGNPLTIALAGTVPNFSRICSIYSTDYTEHIPSSSDPCVVLNPSATGTSSSTTYGYLIQTISGVSLGSFGTASRYFAIRRDPSNKVFNIYYRSDHYDSYIHGACITTLDNGILPLYLGFFFQTSGGNGGSGKKASVFGTKDESGGGGASGNLAYGVLDFYTYNTYYFTTDRMAATKSSNAPSWTEYQSLTKKVIGSGGAGGSNGGAGGSPNSQDSDYSAYYYGLYIDGEYKSLHGGSNGGEYRNSGGNFTTDYNKISGCADVETYIFSDTHSDFKNISNSGGTNEDWGGGGGASFFGNGGNGTKEQGSSVENTYGAGGGGGAGDNEESKTKGGKGGRGCVVFFY